MIGLATLTSRVEAWECDFNGHWNTRFYARAFQEAAERVAILDGYGNPGAEALGVRHLRFHRELFAGAPVELSSARVEGGPFADAVVHFLYSEGRLAATALDRPGMGSFHLPAVDAAVLGSALPRGIADFDPGLWGLDAAGELKTELGIVRPADLDHRGHILFDEMVRRTAYAAHRNVVNMGITPRFMAETGIGRMVVEMRFTAGGRPAAGMPLYAASRLTSLGPRHLESAYCVRDFGGTAVALVELYMLAVDLQERKVAHFPDDFLERNADAVQG